MKAAYLSISKTGITRLRQGYGVASRCRLQRQPLIVRFSGCLQRLERQACSSAPDRALFGFVNPVLLSGQR